MSDVYPACVGPTQAIPSNRHLVDRFGRVHRSLRISVTDVCNIRCQYCMPAENVQFLPREKLLSFDEIATFVAAVVDCGVVNLRITGGEPLLRPDLHQLVQLLSGIQGVQDVALTTNGMFLAEQLAKLVEAGLQRVNVSLDTLSEATFKRLSRRDGLERVLQGIDAAAADPRLILKLNALVLRDVNLADALELVEFAKERNVPLRFIEFMPLDGERNWSRNRMVSGAELRELISRRFGALTPVDAADESQPSTDYAFADGRGLVGFIDSVSRPFCSHCDRLRLTSDGKIRNCLFGREEWDVTGVLRGGNVGDELSRILRTAVAAKYPSHGMADPAFQPPQRAMYQIGG